LLAAYPYTINQPVLNTFTAKMLAEKTVGK